MNSRRLASVAMLLALAFSAQASWLSDVTGVNIDVNHQVGTGISGMAQPTINAFETSGHRLLEDADNRAAARVAQVDSVLTRQLSAIDQMAGVRIADLDMRLEQRIAQIDRISAKRLEEVDKILGNNIQRVDESAKQRIAQIDSVLQARTSDVDAMLKADIREVDERIGLRIEQLDQLTERRLGNLDTIASKSSATLSSALLRLIAFACILIFAAAALWRIYVESSAAWPKAGGLFARLGQWWKVARPRLVWQLGSAGVCLLILFLAFLASMPIDGSNALAKAHETDFQRSVRALDLINAKYHASQLKILDPPNHIYRAYALKVDLMRDVLTRPAMYQTAAGLRETVSRIEQVEAQFFPARDPDVDTLKALVVFRTNPTRENEYRAAMLCASALQAPPPKRALASLLRSVPVPESSRDFALRQLALTYVENYLSHPLDQKMVRHETTPDAPPSFTTEQLRALAHDNRVRDGGTRAGAESLNALAQVLTYDGFVRDLTQKIVPAYTRMIEQQATLGRASAAERNTVIARRDAAAKEIIAAFRDFDNAIDRRSTISESSAAYAVFALNDAIYTRARAYLGTTTATVPENLSLEHYPNDETRAHMLPPRVIWAKRYLSNLDTTTERIVTYQEQKRFQSDEDATIAFEKAFIDFAHTRDTFEERTARELVKTGTAAAKAAAKLGLASSTADISMKIMNDVHARLTPQLAKDLGFEAEVGNVITTARAAAVSFI